MLTKWLNMLVKGSCAALTLLAFHSAEAQNNKSLTLQEVYRLSEQNYPAIKQKDLIRQTQDLTVKNISSGYLPQLSFNGQASYQSNVTRVKIPIAGIKVPTQPKDQYKIVGDVSQLLYDGGLIKEQKNIQQLSSHVDERRVEVELYTLKDRINQIYFSILYQDELLKQTKLLSKDLQIGISKVEQQVNNGTVLRSNLQVLQVQLLQIQQRAIEIRNTRKGLTDALSLFINLPNIDNGNLQMPFFETALDTTIVRPEIKLFEDQSSLLAGQEKLINARNLPKASAFIQGGYGRPGLNMLADNFDLFYIAGLRLNWSLGSLYTTKRDRKLIDVNRKTVEVQKETFQLNTQSQLRQHRSEIVKYAELVKSDSAIIELRSKITESAKAQLENAVITSNDYLREINAGDAARQALSTHRLQLLQAQANYLLTAGKL